MVTVLPGATTCPAVGDWLDTQAFVWLTPVNCGTSPAAWTRSAAIVADISKTSGTIACVGGGGGGVGSSMLTENPPGRTPSTCTLMPVSEVNACPTVSAVVVRREIGAVLFCACPCGSDV